MSDYNNTLMTIADEYNSRDMVYSVAELTNEIKILLETSIPSIWVEGEISNFVHHSSGHMYFTLKDENAQLSSVMWRSRNSSLYFTPRNGMKVHVFGNIRVYEKRGSYQIDVVKMVPAGIGELQRAFEKLKTDLRDEGLFDEQYKKPLPEYPQRIGLITSPSGAAVEDMIDVLTRRFPSIQIVLRPALVQGEGAADDIANAIYEMNEFGQVDVLIVGRGGGSLEDLWAFNEEAVARAIFQSEIPIVSAVGHEIDFTISDFVADLRAPTPSAAAELVVPHKQDVLAQISFLQNRIYSTILQWISNNREKLEYIRSGYGFKRPMDLVSQYRQRIDEIRRLYSLFLKHRLQSDKNQFEQLQRQLFSLNPESILKRGYCLCMDQEGKHVIQKVTDLSENEHIRVHFYRGGIQANVLAVDKEASLKGLLQKNQNSDEVS